MQRQQSGGDYPIQPGPWFHLRWLPVPIECLSGLGVRVMIRAEESEELAGKDPPACRRVLLDVQALRALARRHGVAGATWYKAFFVCWISFSVQSHKLGAVHFNYSKVKDYEY